MSENETNDVDFAKPYGYDEAVQQQKDALKESAQEILEVEPTKVVAVEPHNPGLSKVVPPTPAPHPRFWYDPDASDADRKAQEIAQNEKAGATPAVADQKVAEDNAKNDEKDDKEDN